MQFTNNLEVSLKGDILSLCGKKGTEIRIWNGAPSYEKEYKKYSIDAQEFRLLDEFPGKDGRFIIQLFDEDEMIDERIVNIVPGTPRLASNVQKTELVSKAPKGMVTIPAGKFKNEHKYRTGDSFIKYPQNPVENGESVEMHKFFMDEHPVTNLQYKEFLDASGYVPTDTTNFLKHWVNGQIPVGMEHYPVVYVTLEDAKARDYIVRTNYIGKVKDEALIEDFKQEIEQQLKDNFNACCNNILNYKLINVQRFRELLDKYEKNQIIIDTYRPKKSAKSE